MSQEQDRNLITVALHDRFTLESKIIFPLASNETKENFALRFHLKLASGLKISPASFSTDDFHKSFVQHLRYQTPDWTLEELLDAGNALSALGRLERRLPLKKKTLDLRDLRELRILGSQLKQIFQHASPDSDFILATKRLIPKLEKIHKGFKEGLKRKEFDKHLRPVLGYCHLMALESLSTISEGKDVKDILLERLREEYPRFSPFRNGNNENLPNWESKIKRFVQKVFFLPLKRERGKKTSLEMISVIAAGLAMMISLGLVYWISGYFQGQSLGLAAGLVLAYIIKDRVKDTVKQWGGRLAGRILPDDQYRVQDPKAGVRMGTVRDYRIYQKSLPQEGLEAALLGYQDPLEEGILSPLWISCSREISFLSQRISQIHQREEALESVLRINFQPLLIHATHSSRQRVYWDGKENTQWKGEKTYTAYLVLETQHNSQGHQQIIRLQLTRKGIKTLKVLS